MISINYELTKRLTKEQINILKEYVEKKMEIPIRIVYTQEYRDKIAKDTKYDIANREIFALRNSIKNLSKKFINKKINIIHLWVWNGVETPIIIDSFQAENIVNYSIVDLNPTMLEITKNKIHQNYPQIKIKKFNTDIETYWIKQICEDTKKDWAEVNIILLVANWVLFSNEEFVKEIFNSMDHSDFFFVTLELYQNWKDQEIIEPYMIPSVLDLFGNGVKMIGYEPKYNEFSAEIDKNSNRLKMYYSPGIDKSKKYLVLHSYKPTITQLLERMEKFGFNNIFYNEYKEIHSCACLFGK